MIFWQKEKTLSSEEKEAENLLKKCGYEILSKQQKGVIITNIDDKDHMGEVIADYIVSREKEKFAVLVPGGGSSADANEPALRRRLLELERAFPVNGAVLLDLNQGECHQVAFRFPRETTLAGFFRFVIALLIVSAVIGIVWLLATLKLI